MTTSFNLEKAVNELLAMEVAGLINGEDWINMFDVLEDLNDDGTYQVYSFWDGCGYKACTREMYDAFVSIGTNVKTEKFYPIIYNEQDFLAGETNRINRIVAGVLPNGTYYFKD